MANSEEPDQFTSSEATWSGATLFAKAGHIRVQQDKSEMKYLFSYKLGLSLQGQSFSDVIYKTIFIIIIIFVILRIR